MKKILLQNENFIFLERDQPCIFRLLIAVILMQKCRDC